MNYKVFETEIGGRKVTVETGKYAGQANGSCIIRCGDTVVMTNVTMAESPRPGIFSARSGLRGEVVFNRKNSRQFQAPRGTRQRQGDPYVASYRPSYPPVVP